MSYTNTLVETYIAISKNKNNEVSSTKKVLNIKKNQSHYQNNIKY